MKSVLTKSQFKTFSKEINYENTDCRMSVTLRYDDECNNGHNTFSITGSIKGGKYGHYGYEISMAGCIHEEIEKYFPEFKHLIKWHLCSSDGPIHYIANTKYFASRNNIEYAKESAIWGVTKLDTDDNLKFLDDEIFLKNRLSLLLQAFKEDIEALEFTY